MSWDPRSVLYLTQLPLHVNSLVKGEQPYESFASKEHTCYSCPDLLEAIDEEGKYGIIISYSKFSISF